MLQPTHSGILADRLTCLLYNENLNALWAEGVDPAGPIAYENRFYRYLTDIKR